MPPLLATALLITDWVLRLALAARVLMRRAPVPVPVALAWLAILLSVPYVGVIAYLMFGELRLGRWRTRKLSRLSEEMDQRAARLWMHRSEVSGAQDPVGEQLAAFGTAVGGLPPLSGNQLRLLGDSEQTLDAIIADIDAAKTHCHILTYIWMPDSGGRLVAEAVMRAAQRAVECRVLVDAVGSKKFCRSPLFREMTAAGVQVLAALPVNPVRALFARLDLRNHRKIIVIDGRIAYSGSQNITDKTFCSTRRKGVGPWIDATLRIQGPAAQALAVVFLIDWQVDSRTEVSEVVRYLPDLGRPTTQHSVVQVIPSGPGATPMAVQQAVLTSIYSAREELIVTTPYFVPDEATKAALKAAAMRGVRVTVVVPKNIDSRMAAFASHSHYLDLLEAGVTIMHFRDGLLHAKTITIDRRIGMIGSANIDTRSFNLNFEITMFIFDDDFASVLRFMQTSYIERSDEVDLLSWRKRPAWRTAVENAAQLMGPLL
ncbi:MAG: cardiolipin synthase [Phycisphaerales bacterium]|nr:cardiolipin synthase [Phycisphaerales bacterium]